MMHIASNCEFDDTFFKKAGYYIGEELKQSYLENDWASFCTKIFKSGWCVGMQEFFDDVSDETDVDKIFNDYQKMKEIVCVQRAIIPLFYAYEKWPIDKIFSAIGNFTSDNDSVESCFQNMMSDLSGFNLWLVLHGATGKMLRENSNLKQMKAIEKIEKKHGSKVFLASGYRAMCCYKSLLDKFLMKKFLQLLEERNKKISEENKIKTIKVNSCRTSSFKKVENKSENSKSVYSDDFHNNAFSQLRK